MNIPDNIKEIMKKLIFHNYDAYIVGGAVRDHFLKVTPNDYDIFTDATGEQMLEIFPEAVVIGGEERQEKILTVIVDGVEVSQYRANGDRTEVGNNLRDHLATCDFRMNAIACDINGELFDPYYGISDIKNKSFNFVGDGEQRLKEDPLRILRGLRFILKYELNHIVSTEQIIVNHIELLLTIPKERIQEELMKLMDFPMTMEYLFSFNILELLIPEFKLARDCPGGSHHAEPVLDHIIYVYQNSCLPTSNRLTRLSALFHDVAKGVTKTEEDGEIHFYEHDHVSADIAKKWMTEYKFSKDEIEYVHTMVDTHLYGHQKEPTSKKSYVKFFNKLIAAKIDIHEYMAHSWADNQGNLAQPRIAFGDYIKNHWLLEKWYEMKYSESPMTIKDLKVSGKDVIELIEIEPGPQVGEILKELYTMVLDGDLKNRRSDLLLRLKISKETVHQNMREEEEEDGN